MNEAGRAAAAVARTDVAAGTQIAALVPDEICQRDGERLKRLRSNPSSDEAQRLANELGCEKLRSPVLGLMESLARTPAVADVSNATPSGAQVAREDARPALSVGGADVATLTSGETCKRDEDRLVRLRLSPSGEEAQRFASELSCAALRPQVQRLLESLEPVAPTVADVSNATSSGAQAAREDARPASSVRGADVATLTSDETCKRDEDRLARLRLSPSGEEAQRFASELSCAALRPQVQRLLESLDLVAPAAPAPNDLSRSPVDTQTQTPVQAAKSIAAPPSGRAAVASAGSKRRATYTPR